MCANVQTEPLISAWLYLFGFFLFNPHSVGLVILRLYKRMHKCSQLFIERLRAQLKQALWVRMQSDCVRDSHTGEMCQNTKLFTKNSCALHGYPGFHSCHGSPADASFLSIHHSRSFLTLLTQRFLANYQFYWRIFSSWRGLKIPRARRKRLPSWKMWDLICFQCVSEIFVGLKV